MTASSSVPSLVERVRTLVCLLILWTVAFAGLALAARPARSAVLAVRARLRRGAAARHSARQDDMLWQLAVTDARIMADISRAMSADAAGERRRHV